MPDATNPRLWSLPNGLSWPNGTRGLYVRNCYLELEAMIFDESSIEMVEVTGTLGIGKTMCLWYLMVRLVERARASGGPIPSIAYHTKDAGPGKFFLYRPDGQVEVKSFPSLDLPDYLFSDGLDIPASSCKVMNIYEIVMVPLLVKYIH